MKKYLYFIFAYVFFFMFSSMLIAEEFKFISTEDLSKGIQEKNLFVVDCNSEETFKKNHIPGALHIDVTALDSKILPLDKNTSLVFYCKNPHCSASHDGARFAVKQGYANVRVYPLGIEGWEKEAPLEK